MALIKELTPRSKDRNKVHDVVECGYTVFVHEGERYLQLDTYGSGEREIPGKTSQSIQLDRNSAASLKRLLESVFREDLPLDSSAGSRG